MVLASDVKEGSAVRLDGRLYRVLEVIHHAGSGQMHCFIELKLKDLQFGHFADRRFKHSDRLEEIELSRRQMEFIYSDKENCYFMDSETFVQVGIPKPAVGQNERFLREGVKATVELLGEEAITVLMPKIVELKVASTGMGLREGQDNTMKPATLENGIEVLVPQFVVTGDAVRIDTEKMKYIDRVPLKKI